jgi:hypothetical protein
MTSPCFGQGPTAPASEYGLIQFIVMMVIVISMLVSACFTLYMRQYRRRLRIRSFLPLLFGSFGGAALIVIRISYDLVGIEYLPCSLTVSIFYLVAVIVIGPDLVSIAVFLSKQAKRQALNATVAQALADAAPDIELKHATIFVYFADLRTYLLNLWDVIGCYSLDEAKPYRQSMTKASMLREASYEIIANIIFCSPYIAALVARVFATPVYHPSNACTGCILDYIDCLLVVLITAVLGIPVIIMTLRVRKRDVPDPLFYIFDTETSTFVMTPLSLSCGILFSIDPGGLMKSQKVDWMIFEMSTIVYIHFVRTVLQLYRTRRFHKLNEANVRLIDILSDAKGSLLFEKHLIAGTFRNAIKVTPAD